jgi:hypothetical protein
MVMAEYRHLHDNLVLDMNAAMREFILQQVDYHRKVIIIGGGNEALSMVLSFQTGGGHVGEAGGRVPRVSAGTVVQLCTMLERFAT